MQNQYDTVVRNESVLATNKVLRNTYALLGMTMLTSAIAAYIAMSVGISRGASLGCSLGAMALIWFVLPRTANSSAGLGVVFAFTTLLGAGLGPVLNYYMAVNPDIIAQALGATAVIFFGLSFYVFTTKKDFSFMGGFLMIGLILALVVGIANIFFGSPMASLFVSGLIALVMSGFILFDTSRIVNGGETNYLMATTSLYLNIYNLFVSLLHLIGASDD